MSKTVKERVRAWREKKSQEGGRSLSAWLEPDTAQMFQSLQEHFGESTSPLVARAIEALYDLSFEARPEGYADTGETRERRVGPPVSATAADELPAEGPASSLIEAPLEAPTEIPAQVETEVPVEVEAELEASQPDDPIWAEMVAKLKAGVAFKEIRGTLLIKWMSAMKARGVSFEEMADRLNAAEIPTLTGKGKWQAGMIPAFMLLRS